MHKLKHKYTHTMILHDEKWLKINSMSFFLLLFIPQHHPAAHQAKEATWNNIKREGNFSIFLFFKKKKQTEFISMEKQALKKKKKYNNRNDTHYTH